MITHSFIFYTFVLVLSTICAQVFEAPCNHDIFCGGRLLHTVQLAEIFNDSKTFVDRPLRYNSSVILNNFDLFMEYHNSTPSKEDLTTFVEYHFEKEGTEFGNWTPSDWIENPSFLNNISDPNLRTFATDLHDLWELLGREMSPDVSLHPEKYTLVPVPYPVIVPGGRFREFYYWDSYWIQKGLLKSEMFETVRGMISNFVHMVQELGFVPNGGRIYYQRSQPPFLIPMVKNYLDATNNITFLEEVLDDLVNEFNFWENNRSMIVNFTNGEQYKMYRYNSEKNGPRPESYKEDYLLAEGMIDEIEKIEMYSALHSGAESGIDFSSRWFVKTVRAADLIFTSTRSFLPADLNGYMFNNAKLLAEFHNLVNDTSTAQHYLDLADELQIAINTVLWNDTLGCWFDYNHIRRSHHTEFFPTNIVPLWVGAQESDAVVNRVLNYLVNETNALTYPGGIPSSLDESGEQWDFPNAWAPLVDIVIGALENSGNGVAKEKAFELAQIWVSTNYIAFYNSKPDFHMYEKYDVTELGKPGGGGEYEIVIGFGWSNGVIIDFLSQYGDRLIAPDLVTESTSEPTTEPSNTTMPTSESGISSTTQGNYASSTVINLICLPVTLSLLLIININIWS